MFELLYSVASSTKLMSFVIMDPRSERIKEFMSSKKLNFKEYRLVRRGMAIGDIAMARGVYAHCL